MVKCGVCGKYFSPTDGAKCEKCSSAYHRGCVSLPATGRISSPWHCPDCKKKLARDNQAETSMSILDAPIKSCSKQTSASSDNRKEAEATQVVDIKAELTLFREEIMGVIRQEFQLLRNDMADMRSTLNACNVRMSNLEERVVALETCQVQPPASIELEEVIAQLRCDLHERDQELLSNDIEIANLPEVNGENPIHTALLVATKIGVNIEARDIVSAERVGRRISATEPTSEEPKSSRPRHLVVRLTRRHLRDDILQCARVRRGATTADLDLPGPPVRFYVNERLTKSNRQLFRRAREYGNRLGWRFIWSKRGRILARNKSGDSACLIRCEADLQRVFGPEPENSNKC